MGTGQEKPNDDIPSHQFYFLQQEGKAQAEKTKFSFIALCSYLKYITPAIILKFH